MAARSGAPPRVTQVQQRVVPIACGYADQDGVDHLRTDPVFKLACGQAPESRAPLASQPTLSRLENAVDRHAIEALPAAEEAAPLMEVCARCPELAMARDLAQQFAFVLRKRQGATGYEAWQAAVATSPLPRQANFAAGIRRDEAAVIAGLTVPWSLGVVKGHNTRI